MAIVLESVTTVASVFGGSGVGNFKLDVPTCNVDDYVVFCRTWSTPGGGVVSATPTLAGVNMTSVRTSQTNNRRLSVHIGKVTGSGTNTCAFTDTGDDSRTSFCLGAFRVSGVDLSTPFGLITSAGVDGDATSVAATVPSASGRLVLFALGANGHYAGVASVSGGATQDASFDDTNATGGAFPGWMALSHIAPSGSVSPGYTGVSPLTQIQAIAFELYPVGGVPAIVLVDRAHTPQHQALVAQ